MDTIIITNTEASYYIEKVNNLLDDSLKEKYEILPQSINFNFDLKEIIGIPEALYATLLIIEYGYEKVRAIVASKRSKKLANVLSIEIGNEDKEVYNIKTNSNKLSVKINKEKEFIELTFEERK